MAFNNGVVSEYDNTRQKDNNWYGGNGGGGGGILQSSMLMLFADEKCPRLNVLKLLLKSESEKRK